MGYLVGVGLVSFSLMALEICLTRVFSCMIWYHLSFLTISLAMLGFSLGGLVLLFYPSLKHPDEKRTVPVCTALFAMAVTAGTFYVLFKPHILIFLNAALGLHSAGAKVVYFVSLIAIFVTAFLFSGLTISTAITQKAARVGRVYFSNLLGSGLGCVAVIGSLSLIAAFKSMLFIAFAAALAPLAFGGLRQSSKMLYGLNMIVLAGTTACLVSMGNDTIFGTSLITRPDATEENRIYREWNSFSVVDFYRPDEGSEQYYEGLWGLSPAYKGPRPEPIKVIIDSWAITSINKMEEDTLRIELYDYLPSNLPYRLKQKPDVMIIGAGGGIDVLAALHYAANTIHAVEINPSIVKAVKDRFADYAGRIYDHPKVSAIVGEGRHVISRDEKRYDMIQLSGVDTLSGAQASSYSFSESYLYTREAFDEYLRHLKSDGIVTFMRFEFDKPRETLRLLTTAAEALHGMGVEDVSKHVVIIHSNQLVFAVLMLKKSPFTNEELRVLERAVEHNGFRFLYHPYKRAGNEFDNFIAASDWKAYYAAYPYRIFPVSDDDPFFFNYTKIGDLFRAPDSELYTGLYWLGQTVLFYGAALVLLLSVVFIGLPLLRFRSQRRGLPGKYRFMAYFFCLGLAFMFVEILLMQRFTLFLGQPIYSLALILFCLLVFAGIGSYFSHRLAGESPRGLIRSYILLLTALFVTFWLTEWVFDAFLKSGIFVRAALSVILLAPAGFLMGVPFPLGVRIAHAHSPEMVPWGWTINGYASVLGAFLSVIFGILWGFTVVYGIAAALYAAAACLLLSLQRDCTA